MRENLAHLCQKYEASKTLDAVTIAATIAEDEPASDDEAAAFLKIARTELDVVPAYQPVGSALLDKVISYLQKNSGL